MKRIFAGAAAMVFLGVFFAVPLYAAVMLCGMPCCAHDEAPDCAKTCAISAGEPAAPLVMPLARTIVFTTTLAFVDLPAVTAAISEAAGPPAFPSAHAPLHVLNSVFRI